MKKRGKDQYLQLSLMYHLAISARYRIHAMGINKLGKTCCWAIFAVSSRQPKGESVLLCRNSSMTVKSGPTPVGRTSSKTVSSYNDMVKKNRIGSRRSRRILAVTCTYLSRCYLIDPLSPVSVFGARTRLTYVEIYDPTLIK